jgi:hypothetical protein
LRIVVVLVWVLATGVLIVLARQRVNSGLDILEQAHDRLSAEQLLTGHGEARRLEERLAQPLARHRAARTRCAHVLGIDAVIGGSATTSGGPTARA